MNHLSEKKTQRFCSILLHVATQPLIGIKTLQISMLVSDLFIQIIMTLGILDFTLVEQNTSFFCNVNSNK